MMQGIILVYDVTDPQSYSHVKKWVDNIRQNAPDE